MKLTDKQLEILTNAYEMCNDITNHMLMDAQQEYIKQGGAEQLRLIACHSSTLADCIEAAKDMSTCHILYKQLTITCLTMYMDFINDTVSDPLYEYKRYGKVVDQELFNQMDTNIDRLVATQELLILLTK